MEPVDNRNTKTILVLGGATEGYELARVLNHKQGVHVVSSLAGRTSKPRAPCGEVRSGGFGGSEGLALYLRECSIAAVIDATHPFASVMGWNAARACAAVGVPLLRLERPAWRPQAGDLWTEVEGWDDAVTVLDSGAKRVLLAVGRKELEPFVGLDHIWFLIRSVDAPEPTKVFAQADVLLARGPFTLEGETKLLQNHRIDTIVCKNSGGTATDAKLSAARNLGVRVVIKKRPQRPEVPVVETVEQVQSWVDQVL
ncbi:Precorrin-6A reductase [Azospirillaceae bacterium]